jgi:monoamine oxidase
MVFNDGDPRIPGELRGPVERVVIVGAGIAGLTAANALAHHGIEAIVLEARDRLGGRLHTIEIGGGPVDLGGSWIHEPVGNPLTAFAELAGVSRIPGDLFTDLQVLDPIDGLIAPLEAALLIEAASEGFADAATGIAAELPAGASVADGIDRFVATQAQLRGRVEPGRLRAVARNAAESDASGRAEDIGLAHHPGNSLSYGGDYLGDLPSGGYRTIIEAMAGGLDVRLNAHVAELAVDDGGVHILTRDGAIVDGSHGLVTVPLGVLKSAGLRFDPPLPAERRSAIERLGFGRFEKVVLRFERPFWSDAGVHHLLVVPHDGAPEIAVLTAMDRLGGGPVIVAFAFGSGAGCIADPIESVVVGRVRDLLARAIGGPIDEPIEVVRTTWGSDPLTRGAYAYVSRASAPADLDRLGQPLLGRLLFAGEATTSARVGFADGAMSSGIREAKRLLGRADVLLGPLPG